MVQHRQCTDGMGKTALATKRLMDIVCALMGLILLSPLLVLIALSLKIQRNGPVIFRQSRIGLGGKPFTIYKFRTLSSEAEEDGPQLIANTNESCSTKLERFLRGHHLDELPQMWNVLRGDMSLVGPRPERQYYIDKIMEKDSRYSLIYQMRPGLTSEATLYNGYTDTMEKMLRRLHMDLYYLEHRSLWLDCKIIIKTATRMLGGVRF